MAGFRLQLPTIQNWSCHSCGDCCRRHVVEITEAERQRIIDQGWVAGDGLAEAPLLVRDVGPFWNRRWRLGQLDDGACVFLDDQGLCRIHAKFGEAAKPLACRVYPYAFHPSGNGVALSLRFSCPSVVANRGRAVSQQADELKQMAGEVVPEQVTELPPPALTSKQRVDWRDFHRFVSALDETLAPNDVPVAMKLIRALAWIDTVAQSKFDAISGSRLDGFLDLVMQAAMLEVGEKLEDVPAPSRVGRLLFRVLCVQYARNDPLSNWKTGWRGRVRLMRVGLKFAAGRGTIPPMQHMTSPVPFDRLEQSFGGLTGEAEEMFTRYFRVKIQGLQFCGRGFVNFDLVEGFRALALVFPSILWLARFIAADAGRDQLETDDVARAIELADHYHGYTPQFNRHQYRLQIGLLAFNGDIRRLCAWYTR